MKIALVAAANSPHTVKWANILEKKGNTISVFSFPEHKPEKLEFNPGVSIQYLGVSIADGGVKKNTDKMRKTVAYGHRSRPLCCRKRSKASRAEGNQSGGGSVQSQCCGNAAGQCAV